MEYDNVMESYIKIIFKSGMLLNEHDELLIEFWKPLNFKKKKHNAKQYLLTTSIAAGLITSVYKKSFLLGMISAVPLGIELCCVLHRSYKCRSYTKQFQLLVNLLYDIFNLMKKILQHYQVRKAAISNLSMDTRRLIENLVTNQMLLFLKDVGKAIFELILFLCKTLNQVKNIIDVGDLNFMFNIDLNKDNFRIVDTSEESILQNYDRIYMGYIYVTSTFLCSLGLSLCKNEWKSANLQFPELFSKLLPECFTYTKSVYEKLNNDFKILCSTIHKDDMENENRNLETPILNTINSLREQVRTSFNITVAIQENITSSTDNAVIQKYLGDLEKLFAQSADVLRILQFSLYKVPLPDAETNVCTESRERNEENPVALIKHNDNIDNDARYEEFNLSIHGSDNSDESGTSNLEYDELLEYVRAQKLMIRELNEELRKRNIVKQDITPVPTKRTKFATETENNTGTTIRSFDAKQEKLPLTPPPLPAVSTLSDVPPFNTSEETAINPSKDLLAQIKAAAMNRGMEETIFGDHTISSEDSSEGGT